MSSPNGNGNEGTESKTGVKGINMSSLCQTLARVLVNLNEGEYTGNVRQDTVLKHDVSPDQASDSGTREAS
jgi:hypothetical protein